MQIPKTELVDANVDANVDSNVDANGDGAAVARQACIPSGSTRSLIPGNAMTLHLVDATIRSAGHRVEGRSPRNSPDRHQDHTEITRDRHEIDWIRWSTKSG